MTSQCPKYWLKYCHYQYYCQNWDYWYWFWFWRTLFSILILILPSHFSEYWYCYWYCIAKFWNIVIDCLPAFNINSIDIDIEKQYWNQYWYWYWYWQTLAVMAILILILTCKTWYCPALTTVILSVYNI